MTNRTYLRSKFSKWGSPKTRRRIENSRRSKRQKKNQERGTSNEKQVKQLPMAKKYTSS
jgi:hypothetical protein